MEATRERSSGGSILVVDDERAVLTVVSRLLERSHFTVVALESAEEALEHLNAIEGRADAILTDLHLPRVSGLELLHEINRLWPPIPVILMTGRATIPAAVDAIKRGAYDFLVKPFDPIDTLVNSVKRAVDYKRLLERTRFLERQVQLAGRFEEMVGESSAIRTVFALVESVAPTDATVLLLGESGTGKELVASAIHKRSARRSEPFVTINCAALTESVIDSELFGHVAGAFTGATSHRRGLFQEASHGTLFLDEIGELPMSTQVRLLRALQEGEIRPVGSNESKRVDVRVIAATNRDLLQEVHKGGFREDLYYRLNVVSIELPPLRHRLEDLPALVSHFIAKHSAKLDKPVRLIDREALRRLARYDWPGNVRELENALERAVILAKEDSVTVDSLPPEVLTEARSAPQTNRFRHRALKEVECEHIERTLRSVDWRVEGKGGAAELLGMKPTTLRSRMQKHGIRRPTRRTD